ncbi:MAG: HipA domain-containing protein [Phycisphaerales bacterium]|nr:HipA domain-containing protein [Phycisphaerales bacterium]
MFCIVDVDSTRKEAIEPLGTKRKFWFYRGEKQVLYKVEERGTGEDWAEKVASELCDQFGLPHVSYELARDPNEGTRGVVCDRFAAPPSALAHGNQLLLVLDSNYPAGQKYKVPAHTVNAVCSVLSLIGPPPANWCGDSPEVAKSAVDFFCGYVLLDAWIANQDRHHQNWGAIWDGEFLQLAPTFDHGAAMARNLSDTEREERLRSKNRDRQIAHFASRARSAFFGDPTDQRTLTTFDVRGGLLRQRFPQARRHGWRNLRELTSHRLRQFLSKFRRIECRT